MTLPLCESLQKTHPDLVPCQSNESLLQELLTNFSDGDLEGAFQQLASTGSLALKATAEMEREAAYQAELQRSREERKRRMELSDDKRALRKMDRETWEREMKKRRAEENKAKQEAVADENQKMRQLSVDELRAKIRDEETSKGFKRSILKGNEADSCW